MKFKPLKLAPVFIAVCVATLVCLLRLFPVDFLERLERITYDFRVREALRFPSPVSTNLGFVCIDDHSIAFINKNRTLGYQYGLYWPRHVYGRLVDELSHQGATAVAFDVIFGELRPDHSPVQMADGRLMDSDDFFALQLRRAGNVILADTAEVTPPDLFATNAVALGDISTDTKKDSDGVLRRAQAFRIQRRWHPLFQKVAADPDFGVELDRAKVVPGQILLPRSNGEEIKIPLDAEGNFELADFVGAPLPPGMAPKAKPFQDRRVWHMGIVLAAQELNVDLERADVDLGKGRIIFRGRTGEERILPVDQQCFFYIDWSITSHDPRLYQEPIQELLLQNRWRWEGTNGLPNPWADKLVLVGSSATGNDLTDRGVTPLERDTLLASAHWNVANSILTGRFIRKSSTVVDVLIIIGLVAISALVTWRLRILVASMIVILVLIGYAGVTWGVFFQQRLWLPMILPLGGALLMTHVCLVTWRGVFEQAERRRVKSIFSRIVSPNIVNELLDAEKFTLVGTRREVTVLFADVRGFTEFTDTTQQMAEAYVAENHLTGAEAEAHFDAQARETLATVNTYLALVADIVKKHDGTLDKYIGDCVMAFWGAPTPNACHARDCVRAAIEAQRALYDLNCRREEENRRREADLRNFAPGGPPPQPLLPILTLGSGINSGVATVGLMGSEAHISNYTVFGREVNLASRLESLSGRGRILISDATYERLLRDDPELAATCVALPSVNVKGIRSAIKVFEVPWRMFDSTGLDKPAACETRMASGDTSHLDVKGGTRH